MSLEIRCEECTHIGPADEMKGDTYIRDTYLGG